MWRRQQSRVATLPAGARVLVPVFSAAGGAGRSVVAGLAAQLLAPSNRTVVIDPQPRAVSPWADWLAAPESTGLPGLVGRAAPPERHEVTYAAVNRFLGPADHARSDPPPSYAVLADTRSGRARPVTVPSEPRWYAQVMQAGDWAVGVIDTGFPAYAEHVAAGHADRTSILTSWCGRADTIPVVAAPLSGAGERGLSQLADALEETEIDLSTVIVVVTGLTGPELPGGPAGPLRRRMQSIGERYGALIHLPHDAALQARGLSAPGDLGEPTLRAAHDLARTVISLQSQRSADLVASFGAAPLVQNTWTPTPVVDESATDPISEAATEPTSAEEEAEAAPVPAAPSTTGSFVPRRPEGSEQPASPEQPHGPEPAADDGPVRRPHVTPPTSDLTPAAFGVPPIPPAEADTDDAEDTEDTERSADVDHEPDTTSWFDPAALGDLDAQPGVLGDPTFDVAEDPSSGWTPRRDDE